MSDHDTGVRKPSKSGTSTQDLKAKGKASTLRIT